MEALERFDRARRRRSLRYILKCSTRGGGKFFQLLVTEEKKDHFVGEQKALVKAPRREGGRARKLAKRVARHRVPRNNGTSPSVLREDFANAVAAANLVVIQERRKSVGLC